MPSGPTEETVLSLLKTAKASLGVKKQERMNERMSKRIIRKTN